MNSGSGGKLPTDGGQPLGQNPFAALSGMGLPANTGHRTAETGNRIPDTGNTHPIQNPKSKIENPKSRGRVDIRRETGGRGGKTVTVIDGFAGIGLPEKEQLAKKMRAACGCGGTVKDGAIEIQGDQRDTVARILSEAGFRPVFAGG
ncbi:MAG: translation initiation factor [Opitutaceae bacterium]|nr:translation initiation factor [Opitutaceae bacterium]